MKRLLSLLGVTLAAAAALITNAAPVESPVPLAADTDWSKVDWKARLTPEQFYVTRQAGTERPFQNPYWNNKKEGEYRCVCCDLPLFSSEAKYQSGTGWPSFYQPISKEAITDHVDRSLFATRTENRCSRCDAHLGHVFADGPKPTGLRYCMNAAALRFVPKEAKAAATEKAATE